MTLDLNGLINIGVIGVLAFLVRGIYGLREEVRSLKTLLGVNGTADSGLLHEVTRLRDAKHDHDNRLTALRVDVDELLSR